MTKTQTMITIDHDLKEHFSNINLSGLINDYLRSYKNNEGKNVNILNERITKKELDNWNKKAAEAQAEVKKLSEAIKRYEEEKEKVEIARLKEQKEKADKIIHCKTCGIKINKPIDFKGAYHYLCISCLNEKKGV